MLLSLSIKNFILIDSAFINFGFGLNVITGETGAGKSIILDALEVALGRRANASLLKKPDEAAVLAVEFDVSSNAKLTKQFLTDYHIVDGSIVFKRIIETNGRSRALINNIATSAKELQEASKMFFEICGQHEQRGLLDQSAHAELLDDYAQIACNKKVLANSFQELKSKKQSFSVLLDRSIKSAEQKLNLEEIFEEIEALALLKDEEAELEKRRKKLVLIDKSRQINALIIQKLSSHDHSGVLYELYNLQRFCRKMPDVFSEVDMQINEAALMLEEVLKTIEFFALEEQDNLEEVENRLFEIKDFALKHRINSKDIMVFAEQIKSELAAIVNIGSALAEAQSEVDVARRRYFICAQEISDMRKKAAVSLREKLIQELHGMKMEKVDFRIDIIERAEDNWSERGLDEVTFAIKTNINSAFGAISDVASGGELSRIILAFKIALNAMQEITTMIFDEVDSGISGSVSSSVGRKLFELSRGHKQVIVVTHQPQVAVFGDHHYLVTKSQLEDGMKISIDELSFEQKLAEVARMLSGEKVTSEAIKAAESLYRAL